MKKFTMQNARANYVCRGEKKEEELSHYRLNFPLYTHFTSPIRRYADLMVHRLVKLSIQHFGEIYDFIGHINFEEKVKHCSDMTRNADKASR